VCFVWPLLLQLATVMHAHRVTEISIDNKAIYIFIFFEGYHTYFNTTCYWSEIILNCPGNARQDPGEGPAGLTG
jgi:hypothetical protein